ncbi:hypothetical protein PR202_ga27715 [Eleusine coracana subsp. coracana]|uniref:Uncharacterized protein n=1 Tax=Eleusine coracana subsp. coracana TaxID=191504 RepID=A0AAV5DHV8_ELECO|nr:hypothetical protein PR202_ga27715 [Eleusine coracana subsp. coracana]
MAIEATTIPWRKRRQARAGVANLSVISLAANIALEFDVPLPEQPQMREKRIGPWPLASLNNDELLLCGLPGQGSIAAATDKDLIAAGQNHAKACIDRSCGKPYVIDEIGTKLEAMAASTIGQRGIQLVATSHGVTIENLIMNPSLGGAADSGEDRYDSGGGDLVGAADSGEDPR